MDVSTKDDRGQTLLHLAAGLGLNDALNTILASPGGTELLDAKERLHCRCVVYVLCMYACVCCKSFNGRVGVYSLLQT